MGQYQQTMPVDNPEGDIIEMGFGNSPSLDAFGRLRTSNQIGLFDSQQQYDNSSLFWYEKPTGSPSGTATHLPNESSVQLQVTGPGQGIIRQTKEYFRYQPGKSQEIKVTFSNLSPFEAGITRRVMYGDDNNGIFLEASAGSIKLGLRSSVSGAPVDTTVSQSNWNLDKLDGTGASKITLAPLNAQIFVLDLEWLGVGRVRCGFVVNGTIIYVHEFNRANLAAGVYMTTANLPLRYEIQSSAITPAGTYNFVQICNEVSSEGGQEIERGIPVSVSNGASLISVATRQPILSIRPRALFNNIVNRGQIVLQDAILFSSTVSMYTELVYGGTLTSGTFANVDATYSIAEFDTAATAITGGLVVARGYIAAGAVQGNVRPSGQGRSPITSKLPLALDIGGAHPMTPLTDIFSVVCTSTGGASLVGAALNWKELR